MSDWESVKKWMHPKTIVSADLSIKRVAEIMVERDIGSVIVAFENKEIGMLTERDILKKVIAKGLDVNKAKAKDVMASPLITIGDDASIWDAAELMSKYHIRRLSVKDKKGEIIGILTTRTISDALPVISKLEESSHLRTKLKRMAHKE
ncbi:MAG: CBS domain-containing protein [archaeon]|nr:CBS domain-containing protein [archaeon]